MQRATKRMQHATCNMRRGRAPWRRRNMDGPKVASSLGRASAPWHQTRCLKQCLTPMAACGTQARANTNMSSGVAEPNTCGRKRCHRASAIDRAGGRRVLEPRVAVCVRACVLSTAARECEWRRVCERGQEALARAPSSSAARPRTPAASASGPTSTYTTYLQRRCHPGVPRSERQRAASAAPKSAARALARSSRTHATASRAASVCSDVETSVSRSRSVPSTPSSTIA